MITGIFPRLREFADRHSLAVIVVHHIRKQNDSDVFNKVSGTTGLTGSADATFVLEKETRASDTARLYCVGRDIEYQEFVLRFRECSWEMVERKGQEQLARESIPPVLFSARRVHAGQRKLVRHSHGASGGDERNRHPTHRHYQVAQ